VHKISPQTIFLEKKSIVVFYILCNHMFFPSVKVCYTELK